MTIWRAVKLSILGVMESVGQARGQARPCPRISERCYCLSG
jgi:hypothetical protein